MLLYTYRSFDMELPTVDIKDADYIILGLPFDGTTSYKPGARFGPVLIRQATLNLESYILDYDIDIAELKIADAGM